MTYFNHIPEIVERLHDIESHHLYVGVPIGNDFLTMVALVQEGGLNDDYSGTTIHAKNYPYLWIPTANAHGRKASEIPGLYVRGHAAGYNDPDYEYGFCVCFILKKSVHIPARPFIRQTNQRHYREWSDLFVKKAWQAARGDININDCFLIVGQTIKNELQDAIRQMKQPPNAPLTINRKGEDNPLEDTDHLLHSIHAYKDRREIV